MSGPYRTPGERPTGPRWGATWRARWYVRLFVRHHRVHGRHVRIERVWFASTTTRTWVGTDDDLDVDRAKEACGLDPDVERVIRRMAESLAGMRPPATLPHLPGRPVDE